jgi:signal transduction histidine kinase
MNADPSAVKALRDAVHELNNLCATILGFASLAEELDSGNSTITAYLTEIRIATEGVAATARQLRTLSQDLETTVG